MKTKTQKIKLSTARIVWQTPIDRDTSGAEPARTVMYRLPVGTQSVQLFDVEGDFSTQDAEGAFPRVFRLPYFAGRCELQRKFHAGKQIGSFLIIRDFTRFDHPCSVTVKVDVGEKQ